jgi:NAD(P)-dependent dehydrogenase (short-subunit alcohol dehydrogenase family)
MSSTLFPGVAVITGASSGKPLQSIITNPYTNQTIGIGKATATAFAQEGCTRIVLADISSTSLTTTTSTLSTLFPSVHFLAILTDISSPSSVRDLFRKTMDEFKRLDYAVNCAGVLGTAKKSHEMTLEEFDHIVNVDYRGSWLCSREELKIMVNQEPLPTSNGRQGNRGVIVNVASQLGIVARPQARKFISYRLLTLQRKETLIQI